MRCYLIIQMYMIQIFATRRVTDPTLLEGPGEIISPSFSFYGREQPSEGDFWASKQESRPRESKKENGNQECVAQGPPAPLAGSHYSLSFL